MKQSLSNHLRSYRQKAGLTQSEVAFLLGLRHGSTPTRHEEYLRVPSLDTALKYSVIFSEGLRELFPGRYEAQLRRVKRRAEKLLARLGEEAPAHKRSFLERLAYDDGGDIYYVPCEDQC